MRYDRDRSRSAPGVRAPGSTIDPGTPGKTTLVQMVQRAVQPRDAAYGAPGRAMPAVDIHRAAERGVSGSHGTLPHLDTIRRAFGRHDVGSTRAFVGGAAAPQSDVRHRGGAGE